jgi:hypothetical protein
MAARRDEMQGLPPPWMRISPLGTAQHYVKGPGVHTSFSPTAPNARRVGHHLLHLVQEKAKSQSSR